MTDPLSPLLALADVSDALDQARRRVDDALRHPALRRSGGPLAAEIGLRSAQASAALEGHEYDLGAIRAGTVTDPVLQGALRVTGQLDRLALLWPTSPRQVLAKLHVLAAHGVVDEADLGRPVGDAQVAARLDTLCAVISGPTSTPSLLRAAVVHGELLATHPFNGPNGLVARTAARLVLVSGGLDPRGLIAPEVGHLVREPEYVGAANAFATGTGDGLRSWIRHYCAAVDQAAALLVELAGGYEDTRTAPHR